MATFPLGSGAPPPSLAGSQDEAVSTRMKWAIPREGSDPWYDAFIGLIQAIDATAFTFREDRNTIIMGGGTMALVGSTLSWTSAIEVFSPIRGILGTLPANPAGITLEDGEIFYVTLTRHPSSNYSLESKKAFRISPNDIDYLIGLRRGDRIYFRNGDVLKNGDSFELLSTGGGPGTGGGGTGGQDAFARFSSVVEGAQGPDAVDVGVATKTTTKATLVVRTDKPVTAGEITITLSNQSGPLVVLLLNSSSNGGAGDFSSTIDAAAIISIGDLIAISLQTNGLYLHGTGVAAVKVSASLTS
jgi:hypothetical protein